MAFSLAWFAPAQASESVPPRSEPYVWRNVAIGGGGFVCGIVFHPTERDLLYARTDVGGAYRWDARQTRWVALTDWLGPTEGNFTGIESIALDPADPNRVYLAAGTYSRGSAAILRSVDRGTNFERADVPFKMGGNEDGRANGERLAVDPNLGSILYFGSRREGLWKSVDYAATWKLVESLTNTGSFQAPVSPTNALAGLGAGFRRAQSIGIISVVFDPASGQRGSATPVIYAAVSTSDTNLFCSTNAGVNWQPVAGQPVGLRPNHLVRSTDGLFYLSYGSVAGPNNINNGALWKYNPKDGVWTNISPERAAAERRLGWGYGAVCVDPLHPSTVLATSMDRWRLKDEVFRSIDGGATWKGILVTNGQLDYSLAPYTKRITPHWMGGLAVNPQNPDQILFGTGYGIWCSTNATQADSGGKVTWVFLDQGLEETVPLALISPPSGAHLLSGLGDVDGFRHDDLDRSPPGGSFAGPRFSSTRDLAFAAVKPEVIARIGNGGRGLNAHGVLSEDGGKNWQMLTNDPPGGNSAQGKLALAADGSAIVWTVARGSAFVTRDRGGSWTNCEGLTAVYSIIADPVNPSRFYAFDAQAGKVMASTNAATKFEATAASLPASPSSDRGRPAGVLVATAGMEGDLWAGSPNIGLYHSSDGGNSFTKLSGVAGVEALGFGKAAPGKSFPALYLLGTINQLHARYRSDDAGQTWVRIDDARHQYANADVPLIIGDPRIYGRVYFTTGGRGVIYGDPAR